MPSVITIVGGFSFLTINKTFYDYSITEGLFTDFLPHAPSRKVPTQSIKASSGDFKNLLNRKFNPDELNRIWISDITYLKFGSKWHYLCVVIDLFSRKVISWQLSDQPNAQLVINTFDNAVVEAFFKFLKSEETNRKSYFNLADLQISLFEYIDGYSAIDFFSPNDFEAKFFSSL